MPLTSLDIDAADVLHAFRHDMPYLFAGASFIAVGFIAAAFAAVRRRYDALLIYFAIFASLYGLRLWLQSDIVKLLMHGSTIFPRLGASVDYIMPVPALLFMNAANLLRSKAKIVLYAYCAVGATLAIAACISGPSSRLDSINQIAATVALFVLVADLARKVSSYDHDVNAVRNGLLAFAGFALFDNIRGVLSLHWPKIEPLGFAVFLGSLGYVAARRSLERESRLQEIQKELEIAKRIQLSILPSDFPRSDHFFVAARYLPMSSVAGDFYEFVAVEPDTAGLLVADVSGHGVPAALIASMVKLAASSQSANAASPSKFLAGMNLALCGNTQGQYVTAAYVYLDVKSKNLVYSAAGHPPMLLLRSNVAQEIQENGLLLAAFSSASYLDVAVPLKNGDRLLLYTDGLLEAENDKGEFFGQERLSEHLVQTASFSVPRAAEQIIAAVKNWSKSQDDDLTVVVCDVIF